MNEQSVDDYKQCVSNSWTPQDYYHPTTVQPNYIQPFIQMPAHLSIEDRISNIEKDIREIKTILESIKWRV